MPNEAIAESTISLPHPVLHSALRLCEAPKFDSWPQFECFTGVSEHIAELKRFIRAQAEGGGPVLLVGESGLRPGQIARALHQMSENRLQPFLAVDARGLGAEALGNLLFGQRGVVEALKHGTLYISDLMGLPTILLRRFAIHIEELAHRARSERSSGQRLIFSTEIESAERTADNRLAYGLIQQLRSSSFFLKPLRERKEDIPYLVQHLTRRIAKRLGKGEQEVTPDAMLMLTEYSWERNIDELEAVLESVIASAPPPAIDEASLPANVRRASLRVALSEGIDLPRMIDDYERVLIEAALRQTKGNQTQAAQLLRLRVQTLNMKLKRFSDQGRPVR